jgi:DNA (cytosine-5)-methyltransferase 1
MNRVKYIMVDLFCGAGGVTTGAVQSGVCKVVAAVNHDPVAIRSHALNHPDCNHYEEDIRTLELSKLSKIVHSNKAQYPEADFILWASLECTNHSNAKGGKPRDADSRTLANDLFRYIEVLNPDYLMIENVQEFMSWGDLDENGKPISRNAGKYYIKWVNKMKAYGYDYSYQMMNSADFGAYTSRKRYFGCFAKPDKKIFFPETIYRKKGDGLFSSKQWRPVREVLDIHVLGQSVFNRKKPLVDKTIIRITKGVKKFARGEAMIMNNNSPGFCKPISSPCTTITTLGNQSLITPVIMEYYGNGKFNSVDMPSGTVPTKDRFALLGLKWLDYNYSNGFTSCLNEPAGTVTTSPKQGLVTAFLTNPQYSNNGSSIHVPAPVVIASQKSQPLGIAVALHCFDKFKSPLDYCETDSSAMIELKSVCKELNIRDIYHRMLSVDELKRIQGFNNDYVLEGNTSMQKKFLGNAVVPVVVKEWLSQMALQG